MSNIFLITGSLAMALAVVLGAFGAHGLQDRLAPGRMDTFETGVTYHFYHALGLLLAGVLARYFPEAASVKWAGWLMLAGIALFSGSLYLLSIFEIRWLGAVTPVGGLSFILAWLLLAYAVWNSYS